MKKYSKFVNICIVILLLTKKLHCAILIALIEVHSAKSSATTRLPKLRVKGANAEAGALANTLLAVRIISALLSHLCGALSD